MGTGSVLYRIILSAHIGASIVGFGTLLGYATYHARAFRSTPTDAAVLFGATSHVLNLALRGLYVTGALGIVLIAISDGAHSFAAPWVSAAFVVWFGTIGIIHAMIRPAVAALRDRAVEIAEGAEIDVFSKDEQAAGMVRKLALGEALTNVALVVALVLMVWQPGA